MRDWQDGIDAAADALKEGVASAADTTEDLAEDFERRATVTANEMERNVDKTSGMVLFNISAFYDLDVLLPSLLLLAFTSSARSLMYLGAGKKGACNVRSKGPDRSVCLNPPSIVY